MDHVIYTGSILQGGIDRAIFEVFFDRNKPEVSRCLVGRRESGAPSFKRKRSVLTTVPLCLLVSKVHDRHASRRAPDGRSSTSLPAERVKGGCRARSVAGHAFQDKFEQSVHKPKRIALASSHSKSLSQSVRQRHAEPVRSPFVALLAEDAAIGRSVTGNDQGRHCGRN